MLGMFAMRAIRWRMLLGRLSSLDLFTAGAYVLIGYFGNSTLTANAGELVRTYVLSENQGLSKSSVLASIVVEKTLDVSFLVASLVTLSLSMPLPPWMRYLGLAAGGLSTAACVFLVLLPRFAGSVSCWARALVNHVSSSLAAQVDRLISSFVSGTQAWLRGSAPLLTIALTCVTWPLLALAFYFIGQSLGLSISRLAYLLLVTLITLGAIVPALPGQVGTLEFLVVGGLAVFSVDKEQALSFTLLLRLVRLVPLSLGYASLVKEGLRPSDVTSL
jgi:hypothetical protein